VKIKGVASEKHRGKIMFTDVYLSSLNGVAMGAHALREPRAVRQFERTRRTGVPTGELGAQGFLEMSDSKQAAESRGL